ncbi:MAG: helix-turn-helix domain-containing protein [Actinobacteria bacterium]|nr:helix-turn-helix domain-containing protein [Actinomycetota bacterium]MBU1609497.1 helix-turn-helix domain-containing protein [Actinomycetota bacterium]MBU2315332.1 helix-turn-helix domain-containing protein [Actinomycetota bacterium]MBU2385530.1 helix-turn-helix domain-containing protein [Actinomycetota bacterium]
MTQNTPSPAALDPLADRFIDIKELSAFTGVPISSLRELISKGRGPAGIKIGRGLRFRISAVNAWLAELGDTTVR